MARPTARAALILTAEDRSMLSQLAGSRTAATREVERASVLLAFADGKLPTADWTLAGRVAPHDLQMH